MTQNEFQDWITTTNTVEFQPYKLWYKRPNDRLRIILAFAAGLVVGVWIAYMVGSVVV